jgi:hypothetical protein
MPGRLKSDSGSGAGAAELKAEKARLESMIQELEK